jgi:hypothetical protein
MKVELKNALPHFRRLRVLVFGSDDFALRSIQRIKDEPSIAELEVVCPPDIGGHKPRPGKKAPISTASP